MCVPVSTPVRVRQCAPARVSSLPHIRLFVLLTFVGATWGSPSFARVGHILGSRAGSRRHPGVRQGAVQWGKGEGRAVRVSSLDVREHVLVRDHHLLVVLLLELQASIQE